MKRLSVVATVLLMAASGLPGQTRYLSNLKQLTNGGQNAEAYWAPDGKRLVFQSTRDKIACDQIFVMNADGSGQQLGIDRSAALGQFVVHGQAQRGRKAKGKDVGEQNDRAPQRGGVGDDEDPVGCVYSYSAEVAAQEIHNDVLVDTDRIQTVRAG